jgi:thiol-disulfide isomerase/thioredoxin
MLFRAALPLGLILLQATQALAAKDKDALALLNEVSQRYADAKSYHIEAVEERTVSGDLTQHWDKSLMTAIVMSDGRFRYEGRSGMGSAMVISDGTTQWIYHPDDKLYTQKEAPAGEAKGQVIGPEEIALHRAKSLQHQLAHLADRVSSATMLPDQKITLNGKKIKCYVIHYEFPGRDHAMGNEWTVWIDKAQKVIVRTVSRVQSYMITRAGNHIPRSSETTTTYPVVQLDQSEAANVFQFAAPADAKLTDEFPDHYLRTATGPTEDLTGKAAPEVQFKAADGGITTLARFRGKPVFIEFWATWCGPCVELMPSLEKLYAEAADKGLVWLSIDSDEDPDVADKFIAREHLAWPNYHDRGGQYGRAFHRRGIPLGVLIDGEGKIVFYKAGYDIAELRAAIAKLGPEFSSVEKPVEASPSNPGKTPE